MPEIEGQAALYLGIEHVQPPANLSLLFQIDVGTASSAEVLKPGDTTWSYLGAGDAWQALSSSAVLIDSTEGFQKPGVIEVAVPREATLEHDSLPLGPRVAARAHPACARERVENGGRDAQRGAGAISARRRPDARRLRAAPAQRSAGRHHHAPRAAERQHPACRCSRIRRSTDEAAKAAPDYFRRSSERLRHRTAQ